MAYEIPFLCCLMWFFFCLVIAWFSGGALQNDYVYDESTGYSPLSLSFWTGFPEMILICHLKKKDDLDMSWNLMSSMCSWFVCLFYLGFEFMQCYNGKSCPSYNDRDILFGGGWVGFCNGSNMQGEANTICWVTNESCQAFFFFFFFFLI